MKTRKIICSIIVILALAPVGQVGASAQDFYFKDFTADYYLTRAEDGTSHLHVKEVLTAVFPEANQNHGITRAIPYLNQDGKNRTIDSEAALNLTVLRNGKPEGISNVVELQDSYLAYIGSASSYVQGEQIYTLEYDFANVITEFDANGNNVSGQDALAAFQELYWDTNGTGWSQSFDKLTARLHLGEGVLDNTLPDTWCYVGKYGDSGTERCTTTKTDDGYEFATKDLKAGENLTFVAEFQPGTFKIVRQKSYVWVIILAIEIVVVLALLIWRVRKWQQRAQTQYKLYKSLFVTPQYQAPSDSVVHVAEGGQIYLGKTKSSYVATLLELAVTKAVTIIKVEGGKKYNWAVKVEAEPGALSKSQLSMLRILANSTKIDMGDEIAIKKHTATRALANYAESYRKGARESLVDSGYLMDAKMPSGNGGFADITMTVMTKVLWLGMAAMMAMALFGDWIMPPSYVEVVGLTVLPFVCLAILIVYVITGTIMARKTEKYAHYTKKGIELARYLEGLELYIKMAEKDRLAFLQSVKGADTSAKGIVKLYEKLLPWASLFGREESWVKELAKYYDVENVPEEISPELLNGIIASNMLRDVDNVVRASTNYVSSSGYSGGGGGSSFSSGGGGGGFSGGGGGGGGGGGW